jgi:hypothetical protein
MQHEREQGQSGPRRLPILERRGRAYFIDNRLQEFRVIGRFGLKSIDFRSQEGRVLLQDCTQAACPACGGLVAFPEDLTAGEATCRCGTFVSLENVLGYCGTAKSSGRTAASGP